jgi:predicted DCC family thiol-disulfide oxidoreductase YuxK
VQLVLHADRKGSLRFAPLQGEFAREALARHRELQGVDSMAWVEWDPQGTEQVLVRSHAVLRLASYLGFPWRLLTVGRVVPAFIRDGMYDWIARHRHRWFPLDPACRIPSVGERERIVG